ncbi:MAG: transcriptional regulator [Lachnospiraceae bacterium]|uniref:transcriptional regulator n=1 Tax=Roseburia sp. 1XD42-69 TaxID=2320088 RepID=UPI000EA0FBE1|nr:transcriptional regulator [Roseburia sp. 1XD42-69]MCI8876367.1 transcriptional regulator [Lachnospiraceae bacterium]MDE6906020.1 transcriptional regulator [Lachnospiraceae bacterium]RKJ65158.1 transcriptional regulator [Roseburia sp. 1XD42-69]
MEIINQTNRTLLLDMINPDKMDLLTLVGDVKGLDSLSDDQMREINQHLECHSYEEMERKFEPTVWSFFDAGSQSVKYTLERPENIPPSMLTPINLNDYDSFFKTILTVMDSRKAQGLLNVEFHFEKLLEMISPKKVMEDIKLVRKEIQFNYSKYAALEDGDPAKLDLGDKLNLLFEDASKNYNNIMAMLPLAIEDIKTRLLLGGGGEKDKGKGVVAGLLTMGENGELKILEAPKEESTSLAVVDDEVTAGLVEVLAEDYQSVNESPNNYVQNLVVRTFCPLTATTPTEIDVETEVANYNSYLEFYRTSKDNFIKVVKPLVEKLLGIRMFFDQYKTKTKGMAPTLVVANISPDILAKSPNIPRLITFLNTTNSKNNFNDTIWYAIYPNVSWSQNVTNKIHRERFQGNVKKAGTDVYSMESLSILLNVFKDYRVETFFSFENREETTFNALAAEGVEKIMERCAPLMGKPYSEFAIPVLPNFTILPKNKSGVVLDSRMHVTDDNGVELSEAKEDVIRLWIEGVYISGAYVAAGFRAACQCPEYIKNHFITTKAKTDLELPGVRFDIEAGNNSLMAYTTMPKEITGFTNTIKTQINQKNFGWVFASENASANGMAITNITVYKARNLLYDSEHSTYEPVYKTQVTTYMERILRYVTGDFKEDNIKDFFSNNPRSQKSKWLSKKDCINAIIAEGDSVEYDINEDNGICELTLSFNGSPRNLEVQINRVTGV